MLKIQAKDLKLAIKAAADKLTSFKDPVNALNVFPVPDGDTGTNMSLTMQSAADAVMAAPDDVEKIAKALGNGSLMGARGNSGVILSQLCRGIAGALKGKKEITSSDLPTILEAAKNKAYKAVMKPTEGTMLTVARAMAEFATENGNKYDDIILFLKDILRYANYILGKTPEMLIELKEAGVVDAGGQGIVYLLQGFIESLSGEDLSDLLESSLTIRPRLDSETQTDPEEEQYDYNLQFEIGDIEKNRMIRHIERFGKIKNISNKGDDFRAEVVTNNPIRLLSSQAKRGKIKEVHILMTRDYEAGHMSDPSYIALKTEENIEARKEYGFVAVCMGKGFENFFRDLNVDQLVSGGQTMNPSTRDLWEATEKINAQNIFILPNNKNIILAAEQVSQLTDKNIIVIPSRTMPEGIGAMFQFLESASVEDNKEAMLEGIRAVTTGQITYAVRDTEINGLEIKKGDNIGLLGGDIVATGSDETELLLDMLKTYLTGEHSMVSVYCGQDTANKDKDLLEKQLEEIVGDRDLEIIDGLQPIYSYVFSLE